MKALLGLSRVIDSLNTWVNRGVIWLVLLVTLIAAGNAVMRYGLKISSNAWLELQWFMYGLIFLLGASYTLQKNGHVRVDVLYGKYPPRLKVWVDLLGTLFFLIPTTVIIFLTTLPWVRDSIAIRELSPDAGGLPYWPIKLVLPIAFALLFLQAISELIKRIAMLTGHLEIPQYMTEEEAEVQEVKAIVEQNDQKEDKQ
ncbi:TRAP transporter small permease subunit [Calidithermus roseus]|uniref:Tripartite ATP-independent periplasmic transporter, DctQ component n=1 Tax=Calidithermus roseus TaxID=1644118 RepID=A0A399ERB0_9DEIN|nr:TRAP transporter small permease subunit [Calidithermus roseus]RIH86060.1 Tripartite ATP-independent periplasmic transporter, DctQ component [Calidithermus roseus]